MYIPDIGAALTKAEKARPDEVSIRALIKHGLSTRTLNTLVRNDLTSIERVRAFIKQRAINRNMDKATLTNLADLRNFGYVRAINMFDALQSYDLSPNDAIVTIPPDSSTGVKIPEAPAQTEDYSAGRRMFEGGILGRY